jgi:hypothetical protein
MSLAFTLSIKMLADVIGRNDLDGVLDWQVREANVDCRLSCHHRLVESFSVKERLVSRIVFGGTFFLKKKKIR